MNDERDFDDWIKVKKGIHFADVKRSIKDGEIWWCALGKNVGVEINGKSETFARPILVYKKLSKYGFMGVPLSSQKHVGSWYVSFPFKGKMEYANLAQARVISTARLYKKMGEADRSDMQVVRDRFYGLYCA